MIIKLIPLLIAPIIAFFVPLFLVSAIKALRDKRDLDARHSAYLSAGAFTLLIVVLELAILLLFS